MADKIPSNMEVESTLETAKQEIRRAKHETQGLDTTGKTILDDAQRVVGTTQRFLREKNPDEQLQQLLIEGQMASEELAQEMERLKNAQDKTLSQVDSERLKNLLLQTMDTARLGGVEILRSAQFRNNLKDLGTLLSDLFYLEDTGEGTSMDIEEAKQRATEKGQEIRSKAQKKGVQQTAREVGKEALQKAQGVAEKAQSKAGDVQRKVEGEVKEPARKMMKGEGDQRENIRQVVEGGVNPVLESAGIGKRLRLSTEQLDEMWNRLMNILREISENERSKRVVNGVLEILGLLKAQASQAKDVAQSQMQQLTEDLKNKEHVWNSLQLSREVFENFSGAKLHGVIANVGEIIDTINTDQEIRRFFENLSDFLMGVIENPESLTSDQTMNEGKRIIERARDINNKKLLDNIHRLINEVNNMVYRMESDPINMQLREDMKKLVADLTLDSEGNFVYKPEVLNQLKVIITRSLIERLKVPLPAINMRGEDMDYSVTGLVLNVKDLVPERVLIESRGKMVLDPKQMELEGAAHGLRITMNNINLHMPNAHLWFRRKTFPKIEDEGNAKLDIGGRGMDIVITLRTYAKAPNFFRVLGVDCNVHNLSLSLSDTKHDYIYNTLLNLFSGHVKRDIESAIENNIRGNLEQLNVLLRDQLQKMNTGKPLQESIREGLHTVRETIGTAH